MTRPDAEHPLAEAPASVLAADPGAPLLEVAGLRVAFDGRGGRVDAVSGVGFTVRTGECLAIVGESGSGKSVTARALVGLAGARARVSAERLRLDGRDLLGLDAREWRRVRGGRVGLVLQDALSSLDPVKRVGSEVAEALRNHHVVERGEREAKVVELLGDVALPDPRVRARQYPHQLSGGMRQRALIASAVAAGPALLIADEPTTALDVTVQAQILELLAAYKDRGLGLLLISHDLAVVARLADRVAVMYQGAFVEEGPTADVLERPAHPYTRRLLAAVPSAHARRARLSDGAPAVSIPDADRGDAGRAGGAEAAPVVEVDRIAKSFRGPGHTRSTAVEEVTFTLRAGESLGILGESGSGKTTTAEIVLGLQEPDSGTVRLHGTAWSGRPESARRALRGRIQLVQQDPLGSFDPRYTVERVIAEALGGPGRRTVRSHRDRIAHLLEQVGLDPGLRVRRPRELSGGQRQRVAIARAIAAEPDVLVCDEPVSALDVSVQAQILDLFADLRELTGVALLFISHDLGVIHHTCDRVLVMKDGRIVETGDVDAVFSAPQAAYTQALLRSVPRLGAAPDPA